MRSRPHKYLANLRAYASTIGPAPDGHSAALDWYAIQRARLHDAANRCGLPIGTIVDAAALLSPRVGWRYVLRDLPAFVDRARAWREGELVPAGPSTQRNRLAACRRIGGIPLANLTRGPKVLRFAGNLASGGRDYAVTVDRHAVALARGQRIGQGDSADALTLGEYLDVELAYRALAIELPELVPGLSVYTMGRIFPPQCQALLWCTAVGLEGRT